MDSIHFSPSRRSVLWLPRHESELKKNNPDLFNKSLATSYSEKRNMYKRQKRAEENFAPVDRYKFLPTKGRFGGTGAIAHRFVEGMFDACLLADPDFKGYPPALVAILRRADVTSVAKLFKEVPMAEVKASADRWVRACKKPDEILSDATPRRDEILDYLKKYPGHLSGDNCYNFPLFESQAKARASGEVMNTDPYSKFKSRLLDSMKIWLEKVQHALNSTAE